MKKKTAVLLTTYVLAALGALGAYDWARSADLDDAGRAASYSAGRAFEETVSAVDTLSAALAKGLYATDSGMCSRICSEAYANALAAQAAMSTLPFATQELEQISAFLNVAGDYAYTLCAQPRDGFTEEQLTVLTDMSATAADLADSLRELQGGVHAGDVIMDRTPLRMQNIRDEDGTENISARLLAYEEAFEPAPVPEYDGKYGCAKQEARGYLTESAMLKAAADYAGVPPALLQEEYDYAGGDSRRCYRTGDLFLCVSRAGVESMAQSRLVGACNISLEEAAEHAARFLAQHGFQDLEMSGSALQGAVAAFTFSRVEDGAVCLDNGVQIAIALDDGSVYSFNAADYCGEPSGVHWQVEEEEAARALPETLSLSDSRRVILKSPGKRDLACYEFTCADGEGRAVTVYVDAATGKQCKIEL